MQRGHLLAALLVCFLAVASVSNSLAQQANTGSQDLKGRVVAAKEAEIAARVDGRLLKINFTPGQIVKKGDLLFEFDARLRQISLAAAQARLKVMEAQLQFANIRLKNAQTLRERNVSPEIQFLEAQAQRDIAVANAAEATTSVEAAQLHLDEMQLHAPIDGAVSRPFVREGAYLTLQALEQNRLALVTQLNPIHVVGEVPFEAYMKQRATFEGKGQAGETQHYTIILPNGEQYPLKGHLIAGIGEFKPAAQVMTITVAFDNPDLLLRPGLAVTLKLAR